jgi:acetyl esterase/lipase
MDKLTRSLLNRGVLLLLLLAFAAPAAETPAARAAIERDIPYKTGTGLTDYERERCRLDLYLPVGQHGFATLVWFHGGAIKEGRKDDEGTRKVAQSLAEAGLAVVSVNYRLSPKVTYPAYLEDGAAAFAWVHERIQARGGSSNLVFISGHSAGGYLTAMLGLDDRYLKRHGLGLDRIAGLIPLSGQMMTHYTVREERGIGRYAIFADDAAPIRYCRSNTPPLLVLYADKDMASRGEENRFFVSVMKAAGNQAISEKLITDHTHGSIGSRLAEPEDAARLALLEFIEAQSRLRSAKP